MLTISADTSDDASDSSDNEEEETSEDETTSEEDSATTSATNQKRASTGSSDLPEPPRKQTKTATATPASIAPKLFKPPKGYLPITTSASEISANASFLNNLSGKQIWHIAVPENVDIAKIKELDIEAVMRGQPILSQNGVNYGMEPQPSKHQMVYLSNGSNATYMQAGQNIERTFFMHEVGTKAKSAPEKETSRVFTATETGNPKAVRAQPEGLKMRYSPFGTPHRATLAGLSIAQDSDEDMSDASDASADSASTSNHAGGD